MSSPKYPLKFWELYLYLQEGLGENETNSKQNLEGFDISFHLILEYEIDIKLWTIWDYIIHIIFWSILD